MTRTRSLLFVILALCLARLWLMPLGSSFWVDEMVTRFVVLHGPQDASLQVAPQVAQSIYYVLPRAMDRWFGFSEIAYRLPSLLAMLASLWLIAKIAARLIHPDAGWFAAFLCLTLRGFSYQAADARPYALATFLTAASLWLLISWLDQGKPDQGKPDQGKPDQGKPDQGKPDRTKWRDALLFAISASLVWRVQLVLWPMYIVFALYTAVRIARGDTRVGWAPACLVFGIVGVSLIPVLRQAVALNTQAAQHVVVDIPGLGDLGNQLKPGLVGGALVIAALASLVLRWPVASRIPGESLVLILGWWLCDPLCLFLYSNATRHSVFLSRYMDVALPGAALAATAAAAFFLPARYWKQTAVLLGLGVFLLVGRWNHLRLQHHGSDWRGAARAMDAQAFTPETPVICPSPFIEARPPVWRPDYPLNSFLYSHLLTYSFHGNRIPFPFEGSAEAGMFAAALSERELAESGRFAIYGSDRAVKFWREWFESRPELAAMRSRSLGDFGDVVAVVFERK